MLLKNSFYTVLIFAIVMGFSACSSEDTDGPGYSYPACGSGEYSGSYLLPGPGEAGYDADLALLARRYDRVFHAVVAPAHGVNCDVSINVDATEHRDLLQRFATEDDGWDFEAFSGGQSGMDMVDGYHKVAGLYGGTGAAAEAMRYEVLKRQGAPCEEIEVARQHLVKALEATNIAFTIAGIPGVVVRGFMRTDVPGYGSTLETVPLADANGNPLPEEKDNGTWREDNSGLYPNYRFEDSCSRDMMLGWASAVALGYEVIKDDPAFPEAMKEQIRTNARNVLMELMKVRESGYDLEFPDADGRITYHGYINEEAMERATYISGFRNGFYALMALGIVSAFTYAADDPELENYLYDELIAKRDLPGIALDNMLYINMGTQSNFSNYNMAFGSALLALRYINDSTARATIAEAVETQLYNTPNTDFQPIGSQMSFYDFIKAYADGGGTIWSQPDGSVNPQQLADGIDGLKGFVTPPYYDYKVEQCDETELASGDCVFENGTEAEVYDEGGRKGSTVCNKPIPKAIRRPSNYEWRSNPYNPNGGGEGGNLLPGIDFRIAYWLGRFLETPQ